ncbi:MAG: hypothetical protein AB7K24_13540, partial [Gemmataceae bacterium]
MPVRKRYDSLKFEARHRRFVSTVAMTQFLEAHSGALLILLLTMLVLFTLLILVPQLLRARHHAAELQHAEHMKALENGHKIE